MNAAAATSSRPRPAWQIVALREIAVKVRDKNFLISMAVILLITAASFGFSIWMTGKTQTTSVAVVSEQGTAGVTGKSLVGAAEKTAKDGGSKVEYATLDASSAADAREAVKSGRADLALLPVEGGWKLVGDTDVDSNVQRHVTNAAAQQTLTANAKAQGIDLAKLSSGAAVTPEKLNPDSMDGGMAKGITLAFVMVFYLAAFIFGMPIAQSVVEEKQSRIVEILASAIPLKQLLAGKVIGNAVLAMLQVVLFVSVALIGLSQTQWGTFIGTVASASGWFIVFFVAGFFVVACMFAVAGAISSRSEDIQTTSQPVIMLVVAVMMLGLMLTGTALKIASFVPVVSTVAMPSRIVTGDAAWWEPIVALVLAAVAAVVITRVATRLYTRSVMQTGGRLSYKEAFKLQA